MQDLAIALEKRLDAMVGNLASTARENLEFEPVVGTAYQRVYLLPASTLNPTFADGQHMESGIFQVTLCYPENKGAGAAYNQAELIRAQFPRGLSLTEGTTMVRINKTPSISPARKEPGLYLIDVSVPYFAYI